MPSLQALTTDSSAPTSQQQRDHATEMRHVINDIDYMIKAVDINQIESLSFFINDIPYYVTHKKNANASESRVCVQAILGFMPYSVEPSANRQAILAILDSTHGLFNVRFGFDHQGRIFAAGYFTTDILTSPDFMFFPLSRFLQEAQPFMELIGHYLDRPKNVNPPKAITPPQEITPQPTVVLRLL